MEAAQAAAAEHPPVIELPLALNADVTLSTTILPPPPPLIIDPFPQQPADESPVQIALPPHLPPSPEPAPLAPVVRVPGFRSVFRAMDSLDGRMETVFRHCQAMHFAQEKVTSGEFELCCKKGDVVLPLLQNPPRVLLELFTE